MELVDDEELLFEAVGHRVRPGWADDQLGPPGQLDGSEPGELADQPVLSPGGERAVGGHQAAAGADPADQRLLLLGSEGTLVGGREDDLVAARVGQPRGIRHHVDLEAAGAVEHPQQRLGARGVIAGMVGQVGEDLDHRVRC